MSKPLSDLAVVATSLMVSVFDVSLNLIVGILTGSQTMIAQALQGSSDLVTAGLLFVGVKRSRKQPDKKHPLGYGSEVFFWVLIAGMFMFLGTGFLSVYLGYQQIIDPGEVERIGFAFAVLSFGFMTNGFAFSRSLKRLRQTGNGKKSWRRQLFNSSLVETKATFTLDLLGTSSALMGLIALGLYVVTGDARFDGVGGVLVGGSMMISAGALIADVRSLIVGRTAPQSIQNKIEKIVESNEHVQDLLDLKAVFLGSEKMLVLIEVHLQDDLDTDDIEKISDDIKDSVKAKIPSAFLIQVEVETPDSEVS